ncbi:hypothetical protein ACS0PU_000491 [Formica fusca]
MASRPDRRNARTRSVGTHGNRIHKREPPDVTRRGEASPLAGQRRSGGDGSCQFVLSHRDYLPLLLFTLSCERQRHSYGLAIVSALICNGRDRSASLVGFDLAMFGNFSRLSRIFRHPHSDENNSPSLRIIRETGFCRSV